MDINAMFPSDYLKAADLQGRDHTVTIAGIKMEKIGRDDEPAKPVLYFRGAKKGLVLNRTNANTISEIYGVETNMWMGKPITLGVAWVDFQGRQVEAIRVRPQARIMNTGQGAAVVPNAAEVPFNDPLPGEPKPDPTADPFGASDAIDQFPGQDPQF